MNTEPKINEIAVNKLIMKPITIERKQSLVVTELRRRSASVKACTALAPEINST